jgi:hypothetical protein
MAGKPDLVGQVLGIFETLDEVQPWFVKFLVTNQGTGPADPVKVRLTVYDGSGLFSKPFWWCTQTIPKPKVLDSTLPAGMTVMLDFQLPIGMKHTSFGASNIYSFTIEGPADEEKISNNTIASNKVPHIISEIPDEPPPPPAPWRLSVAGVEDRRTVTVRVENADDKPTKAAQLDLHLRVPKPGAATGHPVLAGSAKVPAMKPGEERSVTVVGVRDFLASQRGLAETDPIVIGGRGKKVKLAPLVPFTLSVKGSGSEIGFGPIAGDFKGKIKFPGKK